MSRLPSLFAMGASGAGGAYIVNHSDVLEAMFQDGSRGLVHSLTAPSGRRSGSTAEVTQLTNVVQNLASQVDQLTASQRQSHNIIVSSNQPSTLLGMPLWKVVGLVGTAGTVYMKATGYEMRDLVYVSRKHFDTATSALKDQYEQLVADVGQVKFDLLSRLGLVESQLDETRTSIHDKIDTEMARVDNRFSHLNDGVDRVETSIAQQKHDIDGIAAEVSAVRNGLAEMTNELDLRLKPIHQDISSFKDESHHATRELGNQITRVRSTMTDLQVSHHELSDRSDHTSHGVALLCKFVSQPNAPGVVDELKDYAHESEGSRRVMAKRKSSPALMAKPKPKGLVGMKSNEAVAAE